RTGQRLRANETQVVGRGMVLREATVRGPAYAADRKVEARRAVLPLVVAVRREIVDLEAFQAVAQREHGGAVHLGVAAPGALVVDLARIADARHDQPVPDPSRPALVDGQPGDRADRPGDEQKAV